MHTASFIAEHSLERSSNGLGSLQLCASPQRRRQARLALCYQQLGPARPRWQLNNHQCIWTTCCTAMRTSSYADPLLGFRICRRSYCRSAAHSEDSQAVSQAVSALSMLQLDATYALCADQPSRLMHRGRYNKQHYLLAL